MGARVRPTILPPLCPSANPPSRVGLQSVGVGLQTVSPGLQTVRHGDLRAWTDGRTDGRTGLRRSICLTNQPLENRLRANMGTKFLHVIPDQRRSV